MKMGKTGARGTAVLAALVLFVSACGGSGYGDTLEPTAPRAPTERPTNAPTLAAPPSATAEPTMGAAPNETVTAAPSAQLTLVASGVRFEQASLTAPAGMVTIEFANRDQGIPHNVHVFKGGDASGTSIASTEIQAGAVQQTLALGELPAGVYFFRCDVHPSQMMGTLTVS